MATVVEGDPKAFFSIATSPRCEGERDSFPGFLHFTLDPYLITPSFKQGDIKYDILSLWYESTGDWTLVSRAIGKHSTHYNDLIWIPKTISIYANRSIDKRQYRRPQQAIHLIERMHGFNERTVY